ncbi:LTA synthase family protein [bacterium AH-315-C07]|nr:LTA synthase family protein [bacterium AH-315-C07]
MVVNSAAIVCNIIDIEYFKFIEKRSTMDLFSLIQLGNDFANLAPRFLLDFGFLLLFVVLIMFPAMKLYNRISIRTLNSGVLFNTVITAIVLFCFGVGARGGIQLRPLKSSDAGKYIAVKHISLVLNTPFTLIRSIGKEKLTRLEHYSYNEVNQIYDLSREYRKAIVDKPTKKPNIVILILESFSKEYIGGLNSYSGYTPFLDSLMEHSLVYSNAFASGKRSIEAMPAIFAGIPVLMDEPYITSQYQNNKILALPHILNEAGYHTSFFHGGINGTMGFDSFSSFIGISKYYGRNEYDNDEDFDGSWGIWDEEFLQYFSQTLTKYPEPFFTTFFSLSSHHPFDIPGKYGDKYPEGKLDIHRSILYSDHSLKKFFKSASQTEWYKNTLFVILADHTSFSQVPEYKTMIGMYRIPLILFHPADSTIKGRSDKIVSQLDIMPTVVDYIGLENKFKCFGKSILQEKDGNEVSFNYLAGIYQIMDNEYLLQFDGDRTTGFFNHSKDSLLRNNLVDSLSIQNKYEQKLKAIMQQFNNNLIDNSLVNNLPTNYE